MQVTADILNFKPPRPGRWGKPVVLALVAHALLMAALTWGVHWKQDEPPVAFEAEIWSALPREAAPGGDAALQGQYAQSFAAAEADAYLSALKVRYKAEI